MYVWEGGPALVQTVDFFTPIVDDPYVYGQIAAANSLSDVYAMGGRPLTALAIAGFPATGIDSDDIAAIFRGGFDALQDAGVALLGGHTVKDSEIKFGYAVTGAIDPRRILTNGGAQPGDVLLLTKPLGTGIVGTAIKFGRAPQSLVDQAVTSMRTLNRASGEVVAGHPGVHACTDVTGFGLIGHATEMAAASDVTLMITSGSVPCFAGVLDIAQQNASGGLASNEDHFASGVDISPEVAPELRALLYDPQTSGGLLIAVAGVDSGALSDALARRGVTSHVIGHVVARENRAIKIG